MNEFMASDIGRLIASGGGLGKITAATAPVIAIPTTIFFDRAGNQVGQWIVGVPQGSGSVSEAYLAEIEARLAQLNK